MALNCDDDFLVEDTTAIYPPSAQQIITVNRKDWRHL